MAEFTPPVVFEETPTLEELTEHFNRTQAIERLNCSMVTLSSAEVSTELSGNLSWHRPSRFRLQAYPGGTRMLGDALDAGSNEEAFWLLTKIPGERHTLPRREMIVEVEVDTLKQLTEVLPAGPDIVLVDNLPPEMLRRAVEMRNAANPQILLEASGGIDLTTIADVAASGVDRISVGALTHSARWFDVGLDWI